jgi:di/tricarboxylate transporter
MIGVVLVALTRCLSVQDFYDAIDWRIIFLLAGIIPLGIAMEKSGVAQWVVSHLLGRIHDWGPYAALSALYLITALLTELMSNNAAAVILCPIAALLAERYGLHPKPFLLAVAFAASTSFMTPIGYQTNTMIYIPGGYRFLDFIKVGLPLNLLFWIVSSLLIPYFWPFSLD